MSLAKKYRPKKLEDVRGNTGVVNSLKSIMKKKKEDIPHAFLFTGPRGCGKTTLARICADMLGAVGYDLQEIDSAQFRGIDTVRDIRKAMPLNPMFGPVRVWIMDEVHQLSKDAQDGLLKALEDAPEHVYFMLATTEPEKLRPTLRDRCTPYAVAPLSTDLLTELLLDVIDAEKGKVPKDVIDMIVAGSDGSTRAALVILEMIIDLPAKDMLEAAEVQIAKQNEAIELCRMLMSSKADTWKSISLFLNETEQDPESLRRLVLAYCTSVLLKSGNPKAYVVLTCFSKPFYDTGKPGLVMACWEAIKL